MWTALHVTSCAFSSRCSHGPQTHLVLHLLMMTCGAAWQASRSATFRISRASAPLPLTRRSVFIAMCAHLSSRTCACSFNVGNMLSCWPICFEKM